MNCMRVLVGRPLSRCLEGSRKLVMFMLPPFMYPLDIKLTNLDTRVKRKYVVSA